MTAMSTVLFIQPTVHAQTATPVAFRVDTDIYVDLQQPPIQQTVTIFSNGKYYDFGDNAQRITAIDPVQQKVLLLDLKRSIRTEVALASLRAQTDQAASLAPDWMKNISIENWAQDETLTVGNDEFFYTATTAKSPVEAAATQFADFADWSARLNAAYPPKQPPYIRIRFNRLLAEHGVLPTKITKTLRGKSVYAVASPAWKLTDDDHKRISMVTDAIDKLKAVTPAEFFSQQSE